MLFGKKKNENEGLIFSPASGQAVPVSEVPDQVFASKVLGDGLAVILEGDTVVSPVDGRIINVADTYHAYGIETADGLELLVHVGVNTVALEGKGFTCKVKDGQKVKKGDVLCVVDTGVLLENGCPLHTPVLITNTDVFSQIEMKPGTAQAGETVLITYSK